MEGEDDERRVGEECGSEEEEVRRDISKTRWVINRGLRLGKKFAITGLVVSSSPVILPPLITISVLGFVVLIPVGVFLAGYACTELIMSRLLPIPKPPLLLEYHQKEEMDTVAEDNREGVSINEKSYYRGEPSVEKGIERVVEERNELVMDTVTGNDGEASSYVVKNEEKKVISMDEDLDCEGEFTNDREFEERNGLVMETVTEDNGEVSRYIIEHEDRKEIGEDKEEISRVENSGYEGEFMVEEEKEEKEKLVEGIESVLHTVVEDNGEGSQYLQKNENKREISKNENSEIEEDKKKEAEKLVEGIESVMGTVAEHNGEGSRYLEKNEDEKEISKNENLEIEEEKKKEVEKSVEGIESVRHTVVEDNGEDSRYLEKNEDEEISKNENSEIEEEKKEGMEKSVEGTELAMNTMVEDNGEGSRYLEKLEDEREISKNENLEIEEEKKEEVEKSVEGIESVMGTVVEDNGEVSQHLEKHGDEREISKSENSEIEEEKKEEVERSVEGIEPVMDTVAEDNGEGSRYLEKHEDEREISKNENSDIEEEKKEETERVVEETNELANDEVVEDNGECSQRVREQDDSIIEDEDKKDLDIDENMKEEGSNDVISINVDESSEKGYEEDVGDYLEGEHENNKQINFDEYSGEEGYEEAIVGNLEGENGEKKDIVDESSERSFEDVGEYLEAELEDKKEINTDENSEEVFEEAIVESLEGEHEDKKDSNVDEILDKHYEGSVGEYLEGKGDDMNEINIYENLNKEAIGKYLEGDHVDENDINTEENLEKGYEEDSGEYLEGEHEDKEEVQIVKNSNGEGYEEVIGRFLGGDHVNEKDIDIEQKHEDKQEINVDDDLENEEYEEAIGGYLEGEHEGLMKEMNMEIERGWGEELHGGEFGEDVKRTEGLDLVATSVRGENYDDDKVGNNAAEENFEQESVGLRGNIMESDGLEEDDKKDDKNPNRAENLVNGKDSTVETILVDVEETEAITKEKGSEIEIEREHICKMEINRFSMGLDEKMDSEKDRNGSDLSAILNEDSKADEVKLPDQMIENEYVQENVSNSTPLEPQQKDALGGTREKGKSIESSNDAEGGANQSTISEEGKGNKAKHISPGSPSTEVIILPEEKVWEKISAIRAILGYTAATQSSTVDELKVLFVLTGVESPSPFEDPSDLKDVNEKLRILMSIVGTK